MSERRWQVPANQRSRLLDDFLRPSMSRHAIIYRGLTGIWGTNPEDPITPDRPRITHLIPLPEAPSLKLNYPPTDADLIQRDQGYYGEHFRKNGRVPPIEGKVIEIGSNGRTEKVSQVVGIESLG